MAAVWLPRCRESGHEQVARTEAQRDAALHGLLKKLPGQEEMVKSAQLKARQLRQPGHDAMSGLKAQYSLVLQRRSCMGGSGQRKQAERPAAWTGPYTPTVRSWFEGLRHGMPESAQQC